ncbi:hypothetical protein CDAR_101051 [Caerostris darwini]|uniref:Uncharacterized protein n=1 Tax=Caerostris darwini TaxID=1538125 RepID=A0AAV4N845_9ARAC|nr:hypothetical protein CDAR_101051 [Caerostris darwini]
MADSSSFFYQWVARPDFTFTGVDVNPSNDLSENSRSNSFARPLCGVRSSPIQRIITFDRNPTSLFHSNVPNSTFVPSKHGTWKSIFYACSFLVRISLHAILFFDIKQ